MTQSLDVNVIGRAHCEKRLHQCSRFQKSYGEWRRRSEMKQVFAERRGEEEENEQDDKQQGKY